VGRVESEETTAKARAGWERFYIPPIAMRLAMDGVPDRFVAGCERTPATATAEADPCGMTTKEQITTKAKCGGSSPFDFAQGQNDNLNDFEKRG
jgi:hypothetical protein